MTITDGDTIRVYGQLHSKSLGYKGEFCFDGIARAENYDNVIFLFNYKKEESVELFISLNEMKDKNFSKYFAEHIFNAYKHREYEEIILISKITKIKNLLTENMKDYSVFIKKINTQKSCYINGKKTYISIKSKKNGN